MNSASKLRVAFYFHMFSPYHVARLNSVASDFEVFGIEGARQSIHYSWDPYQSHDLFIRTTLFESPEELQQPVRAAAAVQEALDRLDPDVVAAPGWSFSEALAMVVWARERRRPVIVLSESTAADASRTWIREAAKRRVIRHFGAALVGGNPHKQYMQQLGMQSTSVFLGYDVVDNEHFARAVERNKSQQHLERKKLGLARPYFLASSRFIEKKNLCRLVQSYAAYRKSTLVCPWDLVILGDGDLRDRLKSQVDALALGGWVHFPGFQQYETLAVYYSLASAFCHVSLIEQWGLVVNEAMAAGLPVIVSRACGCSADLVKDGENGWQVDPLDTADITRRMIEVSQVQCDRSAMGLRSKEIISDFSPARFRDGLCAAVQTAMAQERFDLTWLDRAYLQSLLWRGGKAGA